MIYFKPGGKYYSSCKIELSGEWHDGLEELYAKRRYNTLPGMHRGGEGFHVMVIANDVPQLMPL